MELTEHSQELQKGINKAQITIKDQEGIMQELGSRYNQTQNEWSKTKDNQNQTKNQLNVMQQKGRLQDSSID